jgi:hypothetical protein
VGLASGFAGGERVELPSGIFYEWELVGCRVEKISGQHVGEVKETMRDRRRRASCRCRSRRSRDVDSHGDGHLRGN